jgi:hypothetical protein
MSAIQPERIIEPTNVLAGVLAVVKPAIGLQRISKVEATEARY